MAAPDQKVVDVKLDAEGHVALVTRSRNDMRGTFSGRSSRATGDHHSSSSSDSDSDSDEEGGRRRKKAPSRLATLLSSTGVRTLEHHRGNVELLGGDSDQRSEAVPAPPLVGYRLWWGLIGCNVCGHQWQPHGRAV